MYSFDATELRRSFGVVLLATSLACVGNLQNHGSQGDAEIGKPGGADTDVTVNNGVSTGGSDSGVAGLEVKASRQPLRHLLTRELLQSINDLVGPTPSVTAQVLPPDLGSAAFDNDVGSQSLNTSELEGYLLVASQAANDVVTPTKAQAFFRCSTSTVDRTCMEGFVPKFGLKVYRRELSQDEVAAYMTLFAGEKQPIDGARQVVRAFLSSPNFFYQPEFGVEDPNVANAVRLTGYERATRLAYLITGTTPSDALLLQAKNGELDDADGVAAAAAKMMQSPKAQNYLRWFAINWLNVNASLNTKLDPRSLPNDSLQLRKDMAEETLKLYDDFAKPGQKFMDFFTANYTYVTPSLAAIYGVTAPPANTWAKVSLQDKPRMGFLTQPNTLYVSNGSGPLAVGRGKYVLLRLLCQTIGSPPSNVANLELSHDGNIQTERQALEQHAKSPKCAACHDRMDPVGFGFEQFDPLGNYSVKAANGTALTGAGQLNGTPSFTFTGAAELSQKLAASVEVQQCIGQKLAEYVLGHNADDDDAGAVALLTANVAAADLPSAIVAFTRSNAFLYRKTDKT